jgi:uncharacterized protein
VEPLPVVIGRVFEGREREVVAVYLFGSAGRGTDGAGSDVDVGLLLRTDPPPTLAGLCGDLAYELERVLRREVDLVVLNRAPADLVHRVLRDGHLVFESDRSSRIAFEVRRRREYFDLLPVLLEYRRPRGTRPEEPGR